MEGSLTPSGNSLGEKGAIPERKVEFRRVESLRPYERNAKAHPEAQLTELVRSIQEFGWTRPILVDAKGIVAGHGAALAAKRIYERGGVIRLPDGTPLPFGSVPVLDVSGWTDAQRRAYIIADNKLAENAPWDIGRLKPELMDLKAAGFDLSLTGFNEFELGAIGGEPASIDDVSDVLPGAKALKASVLFPSSLPYGIPEIRRDMLFDWPDNIRTFAGREVTPDDGTTLWLWQWRSDSLRGLPRDRHVIGFYVDDYRFECVFEEPSRYTAKIINMGSVACIAPNFSMFSEVPKVLNVYAVYKARFVARYFQESGLPVIPDVNWGGPETYEYCFLGLPEGVPLAVQLQNARTKEEAQRDIDGLREAVARLKPPRLLVYSGESGRRILDSARVDIPVTLVLNRVSIRAGHIRQGDRPDVMG